MLRILIVLILFSLPLQIFCQNSHEAHGQNPGTSFVEEQLSRSFANRECEPTAIADGLVCVITGELVDGRTDIIVKGAEPIEFCSHYEVPKNPDLFNDPGWSFNHRGSISTAFDEEKSYVFFCDENGTTLNLSGSYQTNIENELKLDSEAFEHGITNCAKGEIGGKSNHKNTLIKVKTPTHFSAINGSGSRYTFGSKLFPKKLSYAYPLLKVKKANRNSIDYIYDDINLKHIRTYNPYGDMLTELDIVYSKDSRIEVIAPDGRKVKYISDKDADGNLTYQVLPNFSKPITYHYSKNDNRRSCKIIRKEEPESRFLEIEYYKKGTLDSTDEPLISKSDARYNRVRHLKKPVGNDASPIITHTFEYDIHDKGCPIHRQILAGTTSVFDSFNHKVRYCFSDEHRLTSFEKYTGQKDHKLYSIQKFYWGGSSSEDRGQLISKTLETPDGRVHTCRHFKYDAQGNVLQECFLGNLTGRNTNSIVVNHEGVPQPNDNEQYKKNYRYSKDGLNLKTYESDTQHAILYRYVEGTNLLQSKFLKAEGIIRIRNFYEYDVNGILCKEIIDNGSSDEIDSFEGVTERRVKNIRNTLTLPVGLPESVEEGYIDLASGQFVVLNKIVNDYDLQGHIIQQTHYDSHLKLGYTLYWEYDSFGNVISESDALGQVIERKFDSNGNKIFEQGPCFDYYTHYFYDYSNRLIKTEKVDSSGNIYTNTFGYDYSSRLVKSGDIYGNETSYVYNELGQLIKTVFPEVSDLRGSKVKPESRMEYDLLGNITIIEDAEGRKICKKFNMRGQPIEVRSADGTLETFEYDINGNLIKSTKKNGSYTIFAYDYQSRLIQTDHYSPTHKLLSSTSATYNAFHLIEETDVAGIKTHYTYDDAGRLICTEKAAQKHTCHYDSLGRLSEVREYFGSGKKDYIVKITSYDLLHRPISESVENAAGELESKIKYVYDAMGRKIQTLRSTGQGVAITRTTYDTMGNIVEEMDPLGHKTIHRHKSDYYNSLGQNVPCTETTDAMGRITITIKDALGRTDKILLKTPFGEQIHLTKFVYDFTGNLLRKIEKEGTKKIVTEWEYDSSGKLAALIEAVSTHEQKVTRYAYNEWGLQDKIIKPDGTVLFTTYDFQNRIKKRQSSDASIHYTYSYNQKGLVVQVVNNIHDSMTKKEYDANDNLISETLEHDAQLLYTYDRLGRVTSITFPDTSQVHYLYKGSLLKEVKRSQAGRQVPYCHEYFEHDLLGNCINSELIFDGGRLKKTYDLLGRNISVDSNFWKEESLKFDKLGNVLKKSIKDTLGTTYCHYSYDHQNQLLSEKGEFFENYTYDSFYNRTSKNNSECTLNSLHQILDDSFAQYHYDGGGRMIKKATPEGDVKFYYDALDRLVGISQNNQKIHFRYDSENRRLVKQHFNRPSPKHSWILVSENRYLYSGLNELGSMDNEGKIQELRILGMGLGAEIGAAIAIELQDKVYIPIHDSHGNVRSLIDAASNTLVETYRFSAFGEELVYDSNGNHVSPINPWRFSSKRTDSETGLIYYCHRYYDPSLGRWITPDPIGFEGGPNLYAFVSNNPLKSLDLYGLFEETPWEGKEPESRSIIDRAIRTVGRIVKAVGDYLVPIPYVREAISYIGHRLSGRSHESFQQHGFTGSSQYFDLGKEEQNPKANIIIFDGIANSVSDAQKAAEDISKKHKHNNVHCAHNSSHGFFFDLLESVAQKLGFKTHSVKVAIKTIRERIQALGGTKSGAELYLYAHSQGGLILHCALKYLTPEEKQMLNIVTCGSAHMISGKGVKSVMNYVSPRDFIILADPIAHIKNLFVKNKHIKYISSKSFPLFDHSFRETYIPQLTVN